MYQIFVVEDEILIRQSIRDMVERMEGPYAFCGEASDGEMALSMMQDLMPDILLTDIKMPFLDGFGLIQHAKAMMPWLKVIIISGYDEFESAQKAISLGVDLYLLKPVKSADLVDAIQKMAAELEQSRAGAALPAGYDKDEVQNALYQRFMHQLLFGGTNTSQLLERATSLGLDILHPFYQIVLFHFELTGRQSEGWQQRIAEATEDRRSALECFLGSDKLALLVYAKSKEELNERTYRLVNIVLHAFGNEGMVITTLVGNIAQRVSTIKDAYDATEAMLKKVLAVSAGRVIDINDTAQITTGIASFSSSFEDRFGQRLLQALPEDVPALLEEWWSGPDSGQFNSMLYRYYGLVDVLKTAVGVVAAAKPELDKKDIAAQFSSAYDIFVSAAQRDTFEQMAFALLREAVQIKQENPAFIRHSHVISQAEEYIARQYCDPNISLISVSRHVGMSPAHFSTVFSQTIGRTFISYLTSMRIGRAKELLTQTDMKLSAIALEIGYNEPNYFSHVFKKSLGTTPKEYRNSYSRM